MEFVNKGDNPQFSLSKKGILSVETTNKNPEEYYFIKLDESIDQDLFEEKLLKENFDTCKDKNDFIKKINIIISSIE